MCCLRREKWKRQVVMDKGERRSENNGSKIEDKSHRGVLYNVPKSSQKSGERTWRLSAWWKCHRVYPSTHPSTTLSIPHPKMAACLAAKRFLPQSLNFKDHFKSFQLCTIVTFSALQVQNICVWLNSSAD